MQSIAWERAGDVYGHGLCIVRVSEAEHTRTMTIGDTRPALAMHGWASRECHRSSWSVYVFALRYDRKSDVDIIVDIANSCQHAEFAGRCWNSDRCCDILEQFRRSEVQPFNVFVPAFRAEDFPEPAGANGNGMPIWRGVVMKFSGCWCSSVGNLCFLSVQWNAPASNVPLFGGMLRR